MGKYLIRKNKKDIEKKYPKLKVNNAIYPFITFLNIGTEYSTWTEQADEFFTSILKDLKINVGLLLVEFKDNTKTDWYNINNLKVICRKSISGFK